MGGSVTCTILKSFVALLVSILNARTFGPSYLPTRGHWGYCPSLPRKTQNIFSHSFVYNSKTSTRPWHHVEISSGVEASSLLLIMLSVAPWRCGRDTCHAVRLPVWSGSWRLHGTSPIGLPSRGL